MKPDTPDPFGDLGCTAAAVLKSIWIYLEKKTM
jgi:hypothetical protein